MEPEAFRKKSPTPRRAGLRWDERDPDENPEGPGSAGGGVNMSGEPGGGFAAGGIAGSNAPDGAPEHEVLEDAFGDGTFDIEPEPQEPLLGGPSGGAVGGTPAGKRASGARVQGGFSPDRSSGSDATIGRNPHADTT